MFLLSPQRTSEDAERDWVGNKGKDLLRVTAPES